MTNLESLDISFTYLDDVESLLNCRRLKKLNISGARINDVTTLKNLPRLDSVSMWNLWLDREQIDILKVNLPNLRITDYKWDLYETDSIGRVLPKLRASPISHSPPAATAYLMPSPGLVLIADFDTFQYAFTRPTATNPGSVTIYAISPRSS